MGEGRACGCLQLRALSGLQVPFCSGSAGLASSTLATAALVSLRHGGRIAHHHPPRLMLSVQAALSGGAQLGDTKFV